MSDRPEIEAGAAPPAALAMMRLTITPTYELVEIEGRHARTWIGHTEDGIPVLVHVLRIEAPEARAAQHAELARRLIPARSAPAIPLMPGPPRPGVPEPPPCRPRTGADR